MSVATQSSVTDQMLSFCFSQIYGGPTMCKSLAEDWWVGWAAYNEAGVFVLVLQGGWV